MEHIEHNDHQHVGPLNGGAHEYVGLLNVDTKHGVASNHMSHDHIHDFPSSTHDV